MFSAGDCDTLCLFAKSISLALKNRDAYTRLHSDRVMEISLAIADHLGLTERECKLLKIAAALHDIGKIGIPDSILLKPSRLSSEEFTIMQTHPDIGADVLLTFEYPDSDVIAQAIRHHHENFDGSGYPYNLAGSDIPLLSRIITLADNYDAMATRRVYQRPREHLSILSEMHAEVATKHDPDLFAYFIKVIEDPANTHMLRQK